ncbi:MAG: glycosyltransferase family 4 protein, partial [Candidatus Dormibacteraceae bacterium]
VGLVSPYDFSSPGGVRDHVRYLANQLQSLGHETRIFAPSSRRDVEANGSEFYRIGSPIAIPVNDSVARINLNLNLSNARRVNEILERERFDVIHLHEPFMPALPLSVLRASRTANVGTFHAYARRNLGYYYGKGVLGYYLRRLDATIAVSPPARDFVRHYFPAAQPVVVPNGVDVERFRPDQPPIRHLRDDCVNFLFVGRLEKRKGLPDLIRGFERAHLREPRTRLIIVGEGPVKRQLEAYIQQHRVPNVVLAGRVPGEVLPRYHSTADVFCAPATGGESFGIVLLEAMASRLPVLCTEIPGYLSVVTSGGDALTVAPHSPVEIATGMVVLARDPLLRQRLGESGMAKARQRYSWPVVTTRLLEIYQEARARAQGENAKEVGWRVHDTHTSVG